jgi:ferric iron reductase protein FhuF
MSLYSFRWGDLNKVPLAVASSAWLNTITTKHTVQHLAFHHICFALASSFDRISFCHSEKHTGEAFFKRARMLMDNPLDTMPSRLSDVRVLSLTAFYLIEINRHDTAHTYVRLAVE